MAGAEIVGVAASLSLLAGWRLYATVLLTGLALRFGLVDLPPALSGLDALANPWVLGLAGLGAAAELFADKLPLLDSAWDAVHTAIRPVGGALIATAAISPSDPAWQVVAVLLGGGAALMSHGAKAGTRALVNTSPEPFSNIAVSSIEDVATAGGLWLVLSDPTIAAAFAAVLALATLGLLYLSWRTLSSIGRWWSARRAGLVGGR